MISSGVRSKTAWVNAVYAVTAPLLSWMVRAVPSQMTTSEQLGRAMIKVARDGDMVRHLAHSNKPGQPE